MIDTKKIIKLIVEIVDRNIKKNNLSMIKRVRKKTGLQHMRILKSENSRKAEGTWTSVQ